MDTSLQTLLALANTRYYVANTDKLEKIINFRDKLNITVIITVYYASSPTKRSFCASRERGEEKKDINYGRIKYFLPPVPPLLRYLL